MAMKYKKYTLDPFQEKAIHSIEKNHSVVVSAATGTGKTLIADYIIDKYIKSGKKVIYTAPIKALSNQKYRDFKEEYGEEYVGILTGDVTINETAPVLIMTVEVYRNMLMTRDMVLNDICYVIFDEIHYITDIERGTVWEESLIFSPSHVRFLCLSATIPNARVFADWIQHIKEHTVDVVHYGKRAVPLVHQVYEYDLGLTDAKELKQNIDLEKKVPKYHHVFRDKRRKKVKPIIATHLDVIDEIQDRWLPCIFFVFGRKGCMDKAGELAQHYNFLNKKEQSKVASLFAKVVSSESKAMPSVKRVSKYLLKGIGVHHAGLLPSLKEAVEKLFNMGLVKVLYTTETFAVGINMPAKAVCFNTVEKYDGVSFRYLHSKEYFQMAGRAGRRGIDKEGYSIVLVDRKYVNMKKLIDITSGDSEPIFSQFKLCVNTVLNLIRNHDPENIEVILKSNFGYFVKKMSQNQVRIMASFNHKKRLLEKLGYIEEGYLTPKGEFASHIYANEMLITELVFSKEFENLTEEETNILIGAVIYEGRRTDKFKLAKVPKKFLNLISLNKVTKKELKLLDIKKMYWLFYKWSRGCEFKELSKICSLDEGDIIRLIRQAIDRLRQIKRAATIDALRVKIDRCIERLDRDIVSVRF